MKHCKLVEYGMEIKDCAYLYDGCIALKIVVSLIVGSEQSIPEKNYDWFDVRICNREFVIRKNIGENFSAILLPPSVLAEINGNIIAEKIVLGDSMKKYLKKWNGLYAENERFSLMSGDWSVRYM